MIYFLPPLLLTGQQFDDLFHLVLEADVEDTVRLVDDQTLEVLEQEAGGVLQVVQQATRRRHDDIDPWRWTMRSDWDISGQAATRGGVK